MLKNFTEFLITYYIDILFDSDGVVILKKLKLNCLLSVNILNESIISVY